MKSYHSIPGSSKAPRKPCMAFYKYDGSNMRMEYQKKKGFIKFGSRTQLFDETSQQFGSVIPLFREKYMENIERIIVDKWKPDEATIFMEYFGPNSFAGNHDENDIKELKLFDISIHRKGIIGPREFYKIFGNEDYCAELIYEGNLNEKFIKEVRENKYDLNEGVICKGGTGHDLWMCKIKTQAYLDKLKSKFTNWQDYAE